MNSSQAVVVCEDGTVFPGYHFGAQGTAIGELVAPTAMTGDHVLISSGAYAGTIGVFTTPFIGVSGVSKPASQLGIAMAGVISRERPQKPSHWRSHQSLEDTLVANATVGIYGVDTRALTQHLRRSGACNVGIFSSAPTRMADAVHRVSHHSVTTDTLIGQTSGPSPSSYPDQPNVAVVDLGMGAALRNILSTRGYSVALFPATSPAEKILDTGASRVILSGGPGNPSDATIGLGLVRDLLSTDQPVLGLGLGHQLIARALGFATRRLENAHHGTNHPVRHTETARVSITTHCHSHTVDFANDPSIIVTHTSLHDGSVEGFKLADRPVSGLQFHPQGHPGPQDAFNQLTSFLKDS